MKPHELSSQIADQERTQIENQEMYRRPKFLEVLHAIREQMSRDVDYDVDLFTEMVRSGVRPAHGPERIIRGVRTRALRDEVQEDSEVTSAFEDREAPTKKRARKSG